MSRALTRLAGTGTLGAFVDGDTFRLTPHVKPLKDTLDLLLLGVVQRNVYAGGQQGLALDGSSAGTVELAPWVPIEIDNAGTQMTGFADTHGGVLVVQFRFLVRVSDAGLTVLPRVFDITADALATTTGQVACSATDTDYGGANQQQTLALTLPNAKHTFKAVVTIGGTPSSPAEVWATAVYDAYIAT